MNIPKYLQKGDTIGVTATSDGIVNELKKKRVENAMRQLSDRGYNVIATDNHFSKVMQEAVVVQELKEEKK